jgi:hypothetical protein
MKSFNNNAVRKSNNPQAKLRRYVHFKALANSKTFENYNKVYIQKRKNLTMKHKDDIEPDKKISTHRTQRKANGTQNTIRGRNRPLAWMVKTTDCTKLAISGLHVELAFRLIRSLWKNVLPLQSIESYWNRSRTVLRICPLESCIFWFTLVRSSISLIISHCLLWTV